MPEEAVKGRPFGLANYISPITFDEVRGVGFDGVLLLEMSDDEFEERYPNLTQEPLEHHVEFVRPRREFVPVAEKIIPLLDWCGQQNCEWAAAFDLENLKRVTAFFSFSDHRVAVEFKLRFF